MTSCFSDPEAVYRGAGMDPDDLVGRQAELYQAANVRLLRGRDQVDTPTGIEERRERWTQQAPLAQSRLGDEQLCQRVGRPTAPGKLGIKGGKARRDRAGDRTADFRTAPHCLGHVAWECIEAEGTRGVGRNWHGSETE